MAGAANRWGGVYSLPVKPGIAASVPAGLRSAPQAALPHVIARDTFVQRTFTSEAGDWQSRAESEADAKRVELAAGRTEE